MCQWRRTGNLYMKRRILFYLVLLSTVYLYAESAERSIYVWADGDSTCYQLSAHPKITYGDGEAYLFIQNNTTPELTLSLANQQHVIVTYGIYNEHTDPTNLMANKAVYKVGKYIMGGKLIIVKENHLYDSHGNEIINFKTQTK